VSPRYLLDTNVLSELMRPRRSTAVVRRATEVHDRLVTAAPVVHELQYGIARLPEGARKNELEEAAQTVCSELPVLAYDEDAARWHARERARLDRSAGTRPFADGQVAAIAAVNGCVLVTRNAKDFEGYAGLVVEDWFGG
jgi:tRNA(fMet)-specific endonuclease VapC